MSDYPGYLLRRASAMAMTRLAKHLKALHLNPTDATVLNVIDANPNSKQSEIGRMLDIARANMAPLISRLAERGLIERQRVDGRSHALVLSRAGRALIPRIKSAFAQHGEALVKAIPRSQRRAFVAALRAMLKEAVA
ncbi:MAG: MarR family transcriptional regulator [Steroidobacteraceae bacterium]